VNVSEGDFAELFHQVRLINSRVTGIEATTEVLLRADGAKIRGPFLEEVQKDVQLGLVYLEVDGERGQKEIVAALKAKGIRTSEATVSRKIDKLREAHFVTLKTQTKAGRIYEKHPVVERNLRLSRHVRRLLERA
jgi:hypothetical protein